MTLVFSKHTAKVGATMNKIDTVKFLFFCSVYIFRWLCTNLTWKLLANLTLIADQSVNTVL